MRLRDLHQDYDPNDRVAALSQMLAMQAASHTVATPLNRLGEAELCPGPGPSVLAAINAGLR